MKRKLFLLLCVGSLTADVSDLIPRPEPANITLTATRAWRLYESRLATEKIKRARLCKLEMKNRSGHPILVRQLRLRWEPAEEINDSPGKMHAGFYKLKHDDMAIPDEEHFLAPGTWNAADRVLTFSFPADEPLKITAVHRYYVMVKFDRGDMPLLVDSTVAYDQALPLVTQASTQ